MNFIIENKGGNCHPYFFTCDLQFIYKISNNIGIKQYIVLYSDEDDLKALVEQ